MLYVQGCFMNMVFLLCVMAPCLSYYLHSTRFFFVNVTFFYLNENCIWVKHLVSFKFLLLYSLNFWSNGNALEKKGIHL